MKLPVSVVVVNHNAGALLARCIKSCLAQSRQVIVVDNASSDSSLDELESAFPDESRLQVICTGRNLGFARACNIGAKHSTEPYLLFLNPDCILGEKALATMLEALQNQAGAGMAGALLVDPDGTEQGGGRRAVPTPWRTFVRAFGLWRFSHRWPRLFSDFHLDKQELPNQPQEVEAISGACMLVKREAMDKVGPWDKRYFLHCEDLDWCMRFRQNHWTILFVPDATVVHYKGACSNNRPMFVEWHKHKGMTRFYRKFFRNQYPWGMMYLVIAGVWLRFSAVVLHHYSSKLTGRTHGK